MVAPVPAHISKLPPHLPAAALRHPLPTTHHSLPTLFFPGVPPLCTLSCTRFLCFQQLAASFPKTPGWGVPLRNLRDLCVCPSGRRVSALSFVFALVRSSLRFLCPSLSTFRMNTCKSVSKQSTLTIFRMNTYEKQGEGGGGRRSRFSPLRSGLSDLCVAFFPALVSFVFSRLQPLSAKHPGWVSRMHLSRLPTRRRR
jgi:hypothetical protein